MKKTIDKQAILTGGSILPKVEMRPGTLRAEFIYSFDGISQQVASYPFVRSLFSSEDTFVEWAISELSAYELSILYKISCCIYYVEKEVLTPTWFNDRNGKFYFDGGKLQPKSII